MIKKGWCDIAVCTIRHNKKIPQKNDNEGFTNSQQIVMVQQKREDIAVCTLRHNKNYI